MDKFIEIVERLYPASSIHRRGSNAYGRRMEWMVIHVAKSDVEEVTREARHLGLKISIDTFGCGFVHN